MGYSPWGCKESYMSETTWDVCTRECFWVGPYQESKEKFFKPLPPTSCFGGVSLVAQMVKNLPADAGGVEDVALIPGLGRSPGGGHDNPLQYSCLENPMDRGAWQATVYRVLFE